MSAENLGNRTLGKGSIDLGAIKRLSLVAYAESVGFVRDRHRSTKTSVSLCRGADRVLVKVGGDCDVYCTIGGHSDNGSIVDFAMRREGMGYVEAIRALAKNDEFLLPIVQIPQSSDAPDYRKKAAAVWAASSQVADHPYLLCRGIPATVLSDPRFADCWRAGSKGVVVFPHIDRGSPRLCGYELRGDGVKGFGKGTRKGLWVSRNAGSASQVVIVEGSIDALSHAALYPGDAGYAAFGGGLGRGQIDLLSGLLSKAADRGAQIIIAVDNDPAGDQYAATLSALSAVAIERIKPVGKDWNDDLRGASWN
jgi:hypothetical protein